MRAARIIIRTKEIPGIDTPKTPSRIFSPDIVVRNGRNIEREPMERLARGLQVRRNEITAGGEKMVLLFCPVGSLGVACSSGSQHGVDNFLEKKDEDLVVPFRQL